MVQLHRIIKHAVDREYRKHVIQVAKPHAAAIHLGMQATVMVVRVLLPKSAVGTDHVDNRWTSCLFKAY